MVSRITDPLIQEEVRAMPLSHSVISAVTGKAGGAGTGCARVWAEAGW